MKSTNFSDLDKYVNPPYRDGWILEKKT